MSCDSVFGPIKKEYGPWGNSGTGTAVGDLYMQSVLKSNESKFNFTDQRPDMVLVDAKAFEILTPYEFYIFCFLNHAQYKPKNSFSYHELAEILNISKMTVRTAIKKMIKKDMICETPLCRSLYFYDVLESRHWK